MSRPPCDRHKNLEMDELGQTLEDVCPVPSCGHCHDDQGYFEVVEGQVVQGPRTAPNRLFSAGEEILNVIRANAPADARTALWS